MLNPTIERALNEQMNREFHSAYLYLAMSSHLEEKDFRGMAKWMRVQAKEELEHALKFFDFLHERGGEAKLEEVARPEHVWASPLSLFEAALGHEHYITNNINELMNLAQSEKDHATAGFVQWFVKEQVEEESSAEAIVRKLKMVGDMIQGLLMVDRELGMRA